MGEKSKELRCSFCHKSASEVNQLVAGPDVYICDACVGVASDIIRHSTQPPSQSVQVLLWRAVLRRLRSWAGGGRHDRAAARAC